MTTAPTIAPAPVGTEPSTVHEVHCDDDRALCGVDVTAEPWVTADTINCPLCLLTEQCPVCGALLEPYGAPS